ncbi:uncharacterized protein LOC129585251 isoform X2 [Paramacrobiotus metropolitanus]|uniref:uncharacterized protein LOC129585251 isoform X2 n=1 Tax=Paramacrobiotus metropolitanus TaxID=2943436 RepID=UPI0024464EA4|nr:uncharacterized protein LOC129585251 isoform X2 [Paramacrobiotus metropolitanus]
MLWSSFGVLLGIAQIRCANTQVSLSPWDLIGGARNSSLSDFSNAAAPQNGIYLPKICDADDEQPLHLESTDVSQQPIFMLNDFSMRLTVAAWIKLGLLNVAGSYGIHQVAVTNLDMTPEAIENALNVAWESQISATETDLAKYVSEAAYRIRIYIVEFDQYRWFTQTGNPVVRITYTVAIVNTTDFMQLPSEIQRMPLPSPEAFSARLQAQNISVFVGSIFRGWSVILPLNTSNAEAARSIKEILQPELCWDTSRLSNVTNDTKVNDMLIKTGPRTFQSMSAKRSASTTSTDATLTQVNTPLILPFSVVINGTALPPAPILLGRVSSKIRSTMSDADMQPLDSCFQFALDRPIDFQETETVANGITHYLQSVLPVSSWSAALPDPSSRNQPDKETKGTFGLSAWFLDTTGTKICIQLAVAVNIADVVFYLDATLPVYAPIYAGVHGKRIALSNTSSVGVMTAKRTSSTNASAPGAGITERYVLDLAMTDIRQESEHVTSTMVDQVVKIAVEAFQAENPLRLNSNRLNLTLNGYKELLNMNLEKILRFEFSITKSGDETPWNLWKFPTRKTLAKVLQKFRSWWLPAEGRPVVVPME